MEEIALVLGLVVLVPVIWSLVRPLDNRPRIFIVPLASILLVLYSIIFFQTNYWLDALLAVMWMFVAVANALTMKRIEEFDKQRQDVVG